MAGYSQANRPLRFESTLGKDLLLPTGFSGTEGVSTPFAFQVDLVSPDPAIAAEKLLRTPVCLTLVLEDGSERVIHGLVNRFAQLGQRDELTAYQAEIVPWLWFLSLSQDCRIYQGKDVLAIVTDIFRSYDYLDFKVQCALGYPVREYCVQYRETHLDFVSRLLEEEGIYYYFEHSPAGHVLVLADTNSVLAPCPGTGKGVRVSAAAGPGEGVITRLRQDHAVHTGTVTVHHYDYLQPSLDLTNSVSGQGREEVYDAPGRYTTLDEGERLARLRLESMESTRHVLQGESTCRAFRSGTCFTLKEHFLAKANQSYALLRVRHQCVTEGVRSWETGVDYRNEFLAIPSKVPYRPPLRTRKPVMRGSQTALVVGKANEEIWTDKYGRVKVQFYWDREGKKNEESSCWIRIASTWAGKGWGALQIPRVGQEVIVDFLEGDPDQPIITGSVYNSEQLPPYLPDHPTRSGVKTRSSKKGEPGHYNELRFEDKKGEEEVYLHAERNLRTVVEADESRTVGHDRTTLIQHEDRKTIKDGGIEVNVEKGRYDVMVQDGNMKCEVTKGNLFVDAMDGTQAIRVKKGDQHLLVSSGNQFLGVQEGKQNVTVGGWQVISIRDGQEVTVKQGDIEVKADLGKITYQALQGIELKVGQNSITITQSGVTIKGMTIKIEGEITTEIKGVVTDVSASGVLQVKGGIVTIN